MRKFLRKLSTTLKAGGNQTSYSRSESARKPPMSSQNGTMSRSLKSGPLKIVWKWRIKFDSAKKHKGKKGKVRECWKDGTSAVAKTSFLEHADGCCPSHQHFLMTEARARNLISNARNHTSHSA